MNETELTVGYEDAYEALRTGEVRPLEDVNNIEAAMSLIADGDKQVSQLKALKKLRTKQIDNRIKELEQRQEFMRQIIISTLTKSGEKTVRFPGIGKATKRTQKGKWVIADEDKLLEFLKQEEEYDNIVEVKPSIKKKELNKLLDTWEGVDKLPKEAVNKTEDTDSLSLSFEDNAADLQDGVQTLSDAAVPRKKDVNMLDFTK